MIDLHIHTHFSDGKYSPEEQLQEAARIGIRTLAFTDHDNANGYRQGRACASGLGQELVPGVELTTSWGELEVLPGSADIDLLGYFMDVEHPAFRALERQAALDISMRMDLCCSRLTQAGYPLTLADILAVNPRFPSLTSAIIAIQDKGYAADFGSALRLLTASWGQVRPSQLEIGQAIAAIHTAGGMAVLAHPAAIQCPGGLLAEARLAQLVELGLDGVEVYHHRNDESARAYFLRLARFHNLLVTGGSDDHGWRARRMGSHLTPPEMLEALRSRHLNRVAS
jgi:3',5'-nucleoside bisphosphate phosphatase